eukprot:365228-Chlamydomonas_euryale.AAC.31
MPFLTAGSPDATHASMQQAYSLHGCTSMLHSVMNIYGTELYAAVNFCLPQTRVAVQNVSDIANWTNNDFWDYVGNDVIPRSAASIAFLALAVCMLIGFLTWWVQRLVRCSMQCCCQKCVGSNLTHEVIGSRAMFWVKVVGILAVLGVLACGIAGLVLSFPPDGNVMQLAWVSAGNLRDYIAQV